MQLHPLPTHAHTLFRISFLYGCMRVIIFQLSEFVIINFEICSTRLLQWVAKPPQLARSSLSFSFYYSKTPLEVVLGMPLKISPYYFSICSYPSEWFVLIVISIIKTLTSTYLTFKTTEHESCSTVLHHLNFQ